MIIIGDIVRGAEPQAGPRFCRSLAGEEAVAADVEENRTLAPPCDATARCLQERDDQRPIQPAVQAEDLVGGEAAGQQCLGHGGQVIEHGRLAGMGRGDQEGEVVG